MPPRGSSAAFAIAAEVFRVAYATPPAVADVFVEYSAHINAVDFRCYTGGWKDGRRPDFTGKFSLGGFYEDDIKHTLEAAAVLNELSVYLAEARILNGGRA